MPIASARSGLLSSGDAIPDSVIYQWRAEDFASPWQDTIADLDMTVNGLTQSTFSNGETSVESDGTNDGLVNSSQHDPSTFGIAFTIEYANPNENDRFFRTNSNGLVSFGTGIYQNLVGDISFRVNDGTNNIIIETNQTHDDGTPKAVVANKTGDTVDDLELYITDMTTEADYYNERDEGYNSDNHDWMSNSIETYVDMEMNAGVFEIKANPYDQDEREAFVDRRPEV